MREWKCRVAYIFLAVLFTSNCKYNWANAYVCAYVCVNTDLKGLVDMFWWMKFDASLITSSWFEWQLLLLVGAKLEHIITSLGHRVAEKTVPIDEARVQPSDEHFWLEKPAIVLDLIQFILFQNSFEIAFFFWIWVHMFLANSFQSLSHGFP